MKDEEDMLELLEDDDTDTFEDTIEAADELEIPESEEEDLGVPGDEAEPVEESAPEEEAPEEPAGNEIELDIKYVIAGVIALVAVITIISVFFVLPMFAPQEPEVVFDISQQGEDLIFVHNGGTPLEQENIRVSLNGAPVSADKILLLGGASWPWSEGGVLNVDTSGYEKPGIVKVGYIQDNMFYDLASIMAQPTPTPEPTPVPTPEPTPKETPVESYSTPFLPPVSQMQFASMSAQPTSGIAPLTVQFADMTAVCILNRTFEFGDGQESSRRYPVHIYPFPGTYDATLDLDYCDPDDNDSPPANQSITVLPIERQDTLLSGAGLADMVAGGKIYFTVKGPGTTVRIGGRDQVLNPGDLVEFTLNSGGRGGLSVISNAFIKCDYENVTMTVNGEERMTGWITGINIDQYDQLSTSDLTIEIEAFDPGLKGMVNGQPIMFAQKGQLLRLINVGPDSTGKLLFSVQDSAGFNFRGGIQTYEVTKPSYA